VAGGAADKQQFPPIPNHANLIPGCAEKISGFEARLFGFKPLF